MGVAEHCGAGSGRADGRTSLLSAWLAPRDLSLLTPREIEATLENPKKAKATKDMIAGYKVAQDPTEWKRQQADAAALAAEELAQLEAAQDQLASDDEGAEAPKPEGKKRKRPSVTAAKDGDKKKKTTAKAPKSKGVSERACRPAGGTPSCPIAD